MTGLHMNTGCSLALRARSRLIKKFGGNRSIEEISLSEAILIILRNCTKKRRVDYFKKAHIN